MLAVLKSGRSLPQQETGGSGKSHCQILTATSHLWVHIKHMLGQSHTLCSGVLSVCALSVGLISINPALAEENAAQASYSSVGYSGTIKPSIIINVGYENHKGEPFDLSMIRWKEELEHQSNGTMTLRLYPDSSLGTKLELLERMKNGEPIATLADGGGFYSMGARDFGIVFGPYLLKNWDEAHHLAKSKWYLQESEKLAQKYGLRIISSQWDYGVRHLLTTKPITNFAELETLKVRVPGNDIQRLTWKNFGAEPIVMELNQVNEAIKNKEVNAVENPITNLYAGGFHKQAPYLLLTGHVYGFTNIVISELTWQNLTTLQQKILKESCDRAAEFYNVLQAADEYTALQNMIKEGVTVSTPSQKMLSDMINTAHSFYVLPEFKDWSPSLYYKVLGAKTVPWSFYSSSVHLDYMRKRNQQNQDQK